jgi:CRISPR-associated protein Csx17
VPLGKWHVASQPHVDLLGDLDAWLDGFRRVARDPLSPGAFARALRRLEDAMFEVSRRGSPDRWQEVLKALGQAERAMVSSPRTTTDRNLRPLPRLRRQWLTAADDRSTEFRLARALASLQGEPPIGPLRANMVPLDQSAKWPAFNTDNMNPPAVVWGPGDLCANLYACLCRRCLDSVRAAHEGLPLGGSFAAHVDDIATFIWGEVDEERLEELLWGLNAVDWSFHPASHASASHEPLPASYALLKLVHLPQPLAIPSGGLTVNVPYDPALARRAYSGQLADATRLAARRLRSSGLSPVTDMAGGPSDLGRRIAAALLFPLSEQDVARLASNVVRPVAAEPATP